MRQNLWTMFAVFATIFAAAWYLNRGKTSELTSARQAQKHMAQVAPDEEETAENSPPETAARSTGTAAAAAQSGSSNDGAVVSPASDSIGRNPPNGMIFAGNGRFQLYRQGDITWRLDTDSGRACILFATDEQWRLTRVFERGCGGS